MEIFALGVTLGMLALLLLLRRPQTTQIVVVPPYPPPAQRRRSPIPLIAAAATLFALALCALLALWARGISAQPQAMAAQSTDRPTPLVGFAQPVAPTAAPTAARDAATLNEQGKTLLAAGRYTDAEALFRQATIADPRSYEPYNNLAFCLYERGATAEAISSWEFALGMYAESADANAGLGMALFAGGQQERGRAHYQRAVGLNRGYADEGWMRTDRLWGARALADSRPLR